MQYRNLQLVSVDDEGYREFGSQFRLERMKLRKKKERAASDLIAELVEDAVRRVLASGGSLDRDRIWKYEVLKQRGYQKEFREMDFVCKDEEGGLIFGEIKSSNNKSALTKALKQVGKNIKLAKRAGLEARGAVVLCGTGDDFDEDSAILLDLPALLEKQRTDICIVRIHLDRLRSGLKGSKNEWNRLQKQIEDERMEAERIRAEREEWREKGIVVADWPEHLQYPQLEEIDEAEAMQFGGDTEKESPMQVALREAMSKSNPASSGK